jgi:hypothetical protein
VTKNDVRKMFGFIFIVVIAIGAIYHYISNSGMTSLVICLCFGLFAGDIISVLLYSDEGTIWHLVLFFQLLIQIVIVLTLHWTGRLEGFWFWFFFLTTGWVTNNSYRKLRMVMKEAAAGTTNSQSGEPNL